MTQPDPSAQSGAADPQSGVAGQQNPTGTAPQDGTQAQSGQQPPATVSREEYDALLRRLQAADKNQVSLQDKLKGYEEAQLTEQQKQQKALEEAQASLKEKDDKITDLELQLAFLSDNTFSWHDPRTALALADRSKVEWKDGKPTNVSSVLEELSKSHPFLLKPAPAEPTNPPAPTGIPMNNGTRGTTGANQADLEARFPALRGRVPRRG